MTHPNRPKRITVRDACGRLMALSDTAEAWRKLYDGQDVLLLGLGPGDPCALPFLRDKKRVYWLETPDAFEQPKAAGHASLQNPPPGWTCVSTDEAVNLAKDHAVFFYQAGMRLAPDFWGPVIGRVDAMRALRKCPPQQRAAGMPALAMAVQGRQRIALLPGDGTQLLHRELRQALRDCGFCVVETDPAPAGNGNPVDEMERALDGATPDFLLSVNMRGLDSDGRIFHMLRASGAPVAVWFVDTPWHILSSVRLPWWKDADLYVTDAAFIPSLKCYGAKKVTHLPLATAQHMWRSHGHRTEAGAALKPPLFIGRASFPERERFFAAARVPADADEEAMRLLKAAAGPASAPDIFWWYARMKTCLWPGNEVRIAGAGADRCSRANRARWLAAGLSAGMRIAGDTQWAALIPGCSPLPPVDYYTALPLCYESSLAVLNVTSLLLPHSLSQRHFDVWAAGGYLLTDATSGLSIFPEELTAPIRVRHPGELAEKFNEIAAHPAQVDALRHAWREHLRAAHSYCDRVERLCKALFTPSAFEQSPS